MSPIITARLWDDPRVTGSEPLLVYAALAVIESGQSRMMARPPDASDVAEMACLESVEARYHLEALVSLGYVKREESEGRITYRQSTKGEME